MLRRILILTAVLAFAHPALASDKKAEEDKGVTPQYVDLNIVALPIIVDGRLVNYSFVRARINLTTAADGTKLRAKEPYFRDALVRAAHRTPLNLAADNGKVDEARLKATLARTAAGVAGPGMVKSIDITSQAPLRQLRRPAA